MAKCSRCDGLGVFTAFARREHAGTPGACFRCNGTGIEPRKPRRTHEQIAADRKAMTQQTIEAGREWFRKQGLLNTAA